MLWNWQSTLWLKIVSFVLFRKSLVSYVDELSQTIRKNLENESRASAHNRLELLLSALVGLVINQRDIVTGQYCTYVAYMHFSHVSFYVNQSCSQVVDDFYGTSCTKHSAGLLLD